MIYGSYIYDIGALHRALNLLGYSHVLISAKGQYKEQTNEVPTDIIVVESLHKAQRVDAQTMFVIDSKPALDLSNVDKSLYAKLSQRSLLALLKKAVANKQRLHLEVKELSLQDVVDRLTTKSILTDVQTLVNKVNPYDLRKKVHKTVISYIYGAMPFSEVKQFFSASPKLTPIFEVCKSRQVKTIKKAVADYKKTHDEEAIAVQYGIHTFEILYVYNSYKKLESEDVSKSK